MGKNGDEASQIVALANQTGIKGSTLLAAYDMGMQATEEALTNSTEGGKIESEVKTDESTGLRLRDSSIYRWNYFYTPVQLSDNTVGVRIAIRDIMNPQESQIYNWGIKKDTSLDGTGRGADDRSSYGVSSDVFSDNSISQNSNLSTQNSK